MGEKNFQHLNFVVAKKGIKCLDDGSVAMLHKSSFPDKAVSSLFYVPDYILMCFV